MRSARSLTAACPVPRQSVTAPVDRQT